MHSLILEALGGLAWLLVGFFVVVAFGSVAREGAGTYGEPSPKSKPQPRRVLVLDPAEAPVIEAATRLLTEIRKADAWIARELEAISPVAKRRVGQGGADSDAVPQHHVAKVA
jgi:hypothetical protein